MMADRLKEIYKASSIQQIYGLDAMEDAIVLYVSLNYKGIDAMKEPRRLIDDSEKLYRAELIWVALAVVAIPEREKRERVIVPYLAKTFKRKQDSQLRKLILEDAA